MTAPSARARDARAHRLLLRLSFGASAALALALTVRDVGHAGIFAAAAIGAVALPWLATRLARRGLPVDWLIAVAALNFGLVVPELGLRLVDFRFESGVQFGYPRPDRMLAFEPDPDLFWRLRPSDAEVNSLGFKGDEIARPKPEGTFRMLFLGDSCTFQGYPERVAARLADRPDPRLRVEAVNLGVPGYSSHQGRVLAELYGEALEPDLVFASFGWNDHWLAYGAPDAEKEVDVPTGLLATPGVRALSQLRLLQLGRRLRYGAAGEARPLAEVRVPLDRYRQNLRAIHDRFAARGVRTIFATAPSAHVSRGVPAYLIEQRFAADPRAVVGIHRRYVAATRAVAAEAPAAELVDLVAAAERVEDRDALFRDDGIHFTEAGLDWVAHELADAARPHLAAAESGAASTSDKLPLHDSRSSTE